VYNWVKMNRLDNAKRAQVVAALVEGNSIRATVRMTGVAKNTIQKLLMELGEACSDYMNKTLRNLPCKLIQIDEIWSFVGAKKKNVHVYEDMPWMGDTWVWVAMDADSKLIVSWLVGNRDGGTARTFMNDLASRLTNRVQVSTDGHKTYLSAVPEAFAYDVDWGVLNKIYGASEGSGPERRYSPPDCIACERKAMLGSPDKKKISTSYIERQNLTMRMSMRRFTRLTNAFSKKVENHVAAVALHYMNYNFCRIHQTLRITPAMAAGVTDHVWSIQDLVALLS
jgi:IS1 family transposase